MHVKRWRNEGIKVLFVFPTNRLSQNNTENGVTLHRFFSVGTKNDEVIAKFADSDYDVIVCDEIYFADIHMLTRIKNIAKQN